MDKQITKERLLRVLDRVNENCVNRSKYDSVITQAAMNGMSAFASGAVSQINRDKLNLELNAANLKIPKSGDEIKEIINLYRRHLDHYNRWRDKIFQIQSHHKISGIEIEYLDVFGIRIKQPNILSTSGLPYIESDLDTLKSYKIKTVFLFMQALRRHNISECEKGIIAEADLFGCKIDYSIVRCEEISVASHFFDWAYASKCDQLYLISFGKGIDGNHLAEGNTTFRVNIES